MTKQQLQDNKYSYIMEKIDRTNDKLDDLAVCVASLPDKILERADKRYASKTAERVIYSLVGVILSAFIIAIWELVLR